MQESVQHVSNRLSKVMDELEGKHSGCTVVLVAHGDTLSILTATVRGSDLRVHREWGLATAELCCLVP